MARINVKQGVAFDFANIDLNQIYNAYDYTASPTVFRADYGGGYSDTFRGVGFTYSSLGEPTGGIVTSYEAKMSGNVAFTIANFAVQALSLVAVARTIGTSDDRSLMKSLLNGNDTFTSIGGNTRFAAYGGNDKIACLYGEDRLDGGSGNDTITGGWGADTLIGGSGRDVFRYLSIADSIGEWGSVDTIRDFRHGYDKIDLRKIDADVTIDGNQAFRFIGASAFDGYAGELRFQGGRLYGDVDGDGTADLEIVIRGRTWMSKSDFYL